MREPTPSTTAFASGTGPDGGELDIAQLFALIASGVQGSVLLTGQTSFRGQRSGRYTPASTAHPAKMLPTIPRYLIATYTNAGDLVADPMAGIGTTIVEAMHLGRHGIGIEYEPRWAALAEDNIHLASRHGASGRGEIYTGDARRLPALLPPEVHGRIGLVITSPPYGSSTHGRAITPGPGQGKVRKINNQYGADAGNLAYAGHSDLVDGFTQILTGCAAVLRPGGHVAVTARPYRRDGELIDIPGMVAAAGLAAGLTLLEELVALIAGIRNGVLIPRASFFQRKNVRDAFAAGDPQWLIQHEDLLLFRLGPESHSASTHCGDGLDVSAPSRMDRRPPPAPPVITHPDGSAADPRSHPVRESGRTSDPCPHYPQPAPGSIPSHTTSHVPSGTHGTLRPQTGSPDLAGGR